MARSIARLGVVVVGMAVFTGAGCIDWGTSAIRPPKVNARAGSQALQEFDTNKDGFLYAAELEKVPGLKAAVKQIDTNGDGKITADEIDKRIQSWKTRGLGRTTVPCQITHDGQPLAGATVVFEPEKFLGDAIKPGRGVTSAQGMCATMTTGEEPPGMAPGFYRVKVTKDGENIPAKYNTETTLGQEIATDAAGIQDGIHFDLQY